MEQKINGILNYCYGDSLCEDVGKLNYQLFVMSLKSMMPFDDKIGCEFDVNWYANEVRGLRYYINGNDELVVNKIKHNTPLIKFDELIEYKIIPIVITNTYWHNIINQVLKCIIFYTYNKDSIIDAIILSSVLCEYMEGNSDIEYLQEITKKRVIEFSIKDFFADNYRTVAKNNYIISFEKERIKYLMYDNIINTPTITATKLYEYIVKNHRDKDKILASNRIYLSNFSSYILKLRKGILDPKKIKHNCNEKTDLKIYAENESFIHPILGKCILINKDRDEVIMKTKIGNIKVIQ